MGPIHCITLPAGYGHSLYGVPMGSIYCITLTAMCSIHVPLLIWSANGFYTTYNLAGWLCALLIFGCRSTAVCVCLPGPSEMS